MAGSLLQVPKTPYYIDDASCRCSLRDVKATSSNHGKRVYHAWSCVGEVKDISMGTTGKWFLTEHETHPEDLNQTGSWAGNPPNLDRTYVYSHNENGTKRFVPLDPNGNTQPSISDTACTGRNDTKQSTLLYRQMNDLKEGLPAHLGCNMDNATPIFIQNASSWHEKGCNLGFMCAQNSVVRLPTYCPPEPSCQAARLSMTTCSRPMGEWEPLICQPGNYCPPGGKDSIQCPAGSFCPLGSYQPIPCGPVSRCPAGSNKSQEFQLLVLMLLVDTFFIGIVIWYRIKARRLKSHVSNTEDMVDRFSRAFGLQGKKKRSPGAYQSLSDDSIALEPRIQTVHRTNTGGFQAMMDNYHAFTDDDSDDGNEKPSTELQAFVQSMAKCVETGSFGLSFEFSDLKYQPKKSLRPVLSEVSGVIPRGSFVGIMGASGAGKSTLVNVLMGKTECTGGITKVNGVPEAISKYKKMIGYVPQDDIVLPELTVRENVLHSARIRLPANWTDIEIQKHVDILLSCLQLSHVRDSLVGSVAKPVISGGQRKRVSIGMELAAAPMALFLDEPTSGLDATSACSVMMTLKALSRLGITIVTIIHQPRQEIFESLDSLMLLGAGRMIYQGQLETAKTYFEHVGFRFPKHANPADVIMDIIAGQGQLYKKTGDFHIGALIENWKNRQNSASRGQSRDPSRAPSEGCTGPTGEEQLLRFSARIRGASWHKQFYFCLHRSLLQQSRMKSSFFTEISVGALAGFLIGLSQMKREGNFFRGFYVQPYGLLSTSVDYFSICQIALMLCLAIGLAASSPGVKTFGEEKLMYWREARAGHSRTAYYLGKVLSTFPRIVFANLHFTTLFMLLATPQVPYGIVFVLNLLYYYCIYGLASIVSMISRREDGPLLATMTSLVVGILNGMAPSLKAVKGWHMEWLWRISPGTWYAEAYFSQNVNPLRYLYEIDNAADETGYDLNSFALDIVMLIVLGTASRIFAFFGLLWVGRGKVA